MNDQLIMDNYLLILKSTVEVYVHGTLESSNDDVKSVLKNGLDQTMNHQKDTYNIMVDNGWYKIENIKTSSINQTLNKIYKNES